MLLILAIGAALGTFIENDFGSVTAKELVYHNYWYLLVLLLTAINIILIVIKTKMYRIKTRALFHIAFVIILIGAALTHYFGIDGQMNIREGQKTNIVMIGDESMELPFDVLLKKFDLIRYPGSGSPSEFKSQLTIIDERNHVSFDANVYMNNTLSYKGYKFFQTSYDTDEGGTILSVNADPGVHITYLGYAMLFLGLILSLFDKKSRFRFLLRRIKETYIVSVFIPLMFITFSTVTVGQEVYSEYVNTYLNDHRFQSKELALEFGSLVVQGPDGRMKPLDTQNREVLNKLSGKSSWEGMTANQVALGVFSRPKIWKKVQIIKVKTPRLRKILGLSDKQKLASFTNFFDDAGVYKLTDEIERANKLVPSKRGTYERDLIKVDERLNIFFMLYRGVLFTIFPLQNSENNQWVDFKNTLENSSDRSLRNNISRFLDAAYNRNYNKGIPHIEEIKNYQLEYGISIIPDQKRLDAEVWFNSIYLFNKLFVFYLLFGFFLLFLGFSSMLSNKPFGRKMAIIIWLIALVSLMINVFGIGIRWYIGGFAPLSSTYETMIYIAFSAITAGIVFLRKSIIALAASFIMAGIFIFAAYLGEVDPEIT
ncbi:MAG: cytochrome c biogenesis protein ResB, partial [Bacteroidales bacterium]|nr:cytochrome c biogenesis protein ResB [Bacteroidales bacterium]